MTAGLHYPDNLYADHEEAKARRVANQAPTGAYRSTDPVTKPAHYQRAGIETIDYIHATLDGPGFEAYCIGNVLKYVSRYREKGGIEDLRKAQVYLGWAIEPPAKKSLPEAEFDYRAGFVRFQDEATKEAFENECLDHLRNIAPKLAERIPKWDPAWSMHWVNPSPQVVCAPPPNCDGLSARDIRAPHPMASEVIRDHDERLSGAEDRL